MAMTRSVPKPGWRWFVWCALAAFFSLGTYVALGSLPDVIDRLRHPPEPVARKEFVPPPAKTVVVSEAPPEIPTEVIAPLKVPVIPGVGELPSGKVR